jgi:glycosyltransferase involved in cell wall biosynthesis
MNLVFIAPFATTPKATVSMRMVPMATALAAHGNQVTILIPPYDNLEDSGQLWSYDGVQIENIKLGSSPNSSFGYLDQANKMARRALALNPDVIHVFKPIGPSGLTQWLMRVLYRTPIPILVDNDDWEGAGGWIDVNPYSWLQKKVMAWQEAWGLRNADAVTCASDVLMQRTQSLCRDRTPPSALLPNGPDGSVRQYVAEEESNREYWRLQFGWGREPVIIYAGTVPIVNDLDVAIRALEIVSQKHFRLRFCIIGSGDGMPALREAIKHASISGAVEFHAFMAHEDVIRRLVTADIAIYPYRDNNINRAKCSGKVVDYMACGKPMVVSDVGMNRVYIEHETSGMLTQPGDVNAFATALNWLIENENEAVAMGKKAQQRLWEVFGWDVRVGELETIYSSAIQHKRAVFAR